ncbi:hypothetical protein H7F51_11785 [Novosphingobium flavum]|uniref:Uncharacterized protein n=1 Tax=Novosphingobium flavum TaxID=1778672 RepID=A0A7X1FSJ7_9SPHN|nr:DUF6491 family protein [Novosphingobium flavum]MBC2666198.1 hypothetical protein [Novosphingobium flavum]
MSFKMSVLAPFAAVLLGAAPALAAGNSPSALPVAVVKADAEIPFANHGGVYSWHAVSDREVWFEDRSHKWYRAELMMPAFDLPFIEGVGIDARPMGTLDRFGGVIVKGQTYRFASFDLMAGPPPDLAKKPKKH